MDQQLQALPIGPNPWVDYWKRQLAEGLPVLGLPTDRSRSAMKSFRGAVHSFVLPKPLAEGLKALGQREGVTLFVMLLAALQTLLCRYTGQDDILVGSPIAGRHPTESKDLMGHLTNMLPLRTDLSGTPCFREVLSRVREVVLGAYAHQDVSLGQLVEEFQLQRNLSHHPLFQVVFILQNSPQLPSVLADVTMHPVAIDDETVPFDLTLSMQESEQGLLGWMEYNTDLFDTSTIARMAGHFQRLLEGVVSDPELSICMLPLLTAAESQQMLVEWNDTKCDYPQQQCLHHLFEAQVERTPQAVAVIFGEEILTYQELNSRANQLAWYLQRQGVGPEILAGICVERSVQMVVGLLGILKAGGAYVPLDPTYPKERLAFMLQDSEMRVLLSQQRYLAQLAAHEAKVICLDTDWQSIAKQSKQNPVSEVTARNLAYVIYTSGSTGYPKGVMISHQGLVHYVSWSSKRYEVATGAQTLVHSSLAFDLTVTSLFAPLVVGQSLLLIPEDQGVEGLVNVLRTRQDFSLVKMTPSHLDILNQSLTAEELPSAMRMLILGGEALRSESLKIWHLHAPETRLINEYGPTEATVGCCVYEVPCEDVVRKNIPIGRPIPHTQIYLLDQHLQPVPIGVPGELHIGGIGLARGYLNCPELTAEKFIPHPFSTTPGERLYKTGDLARYLHDGTIEFLGRLDYQVKLHGFRIEPGEIEAVLLQHPAVDEVVVVAREDVPDEKRLVAYLVLRPQPSLALREVRNALQAKLPNYMIPSTFVQLNTLPLTPNGKLDRAALPSPERTNILHDQDIVIPSTPTEALVASIITSLLRLEQVGVDDNFFMLGGHSLLAARLIARVSEIFRVDLTLYGLFSAPTVRQLSAEIERLIVEKVESMSEIEIMQWLESENRVRDY